jgi:hypothetical protein
MGYAQPVKEFVTSRPSVKSLVRACAAAAIGALERVPATKIAKREWNYDPGVEWLVSKSPSMPLEIADAPTIVQTVMPDFIATLSSQYVAAARIFKEGLQLSFGRAGTIAVPTIFGDPSLAAFVQEGYPIPVVQPNVEPLTTLTPYKIAAIVVLTTEMVQSSNVEVLMNDVLARSVGLALDKVLLDNQPAAPERPAGLRYGITSIAADSSPDPVAAMVADISNLLTTLAPIIARPPILVQSGARTMTAQLLSHHGLDPLIAQGSVSMRGTTDMIMIAPDVIVSALGDMPEISASRESALQMEDAPTELMNGPTGSMWQQDCVAVKVRLPITWGARASTGITWTTATHW